jgi:predicted Zn finger-like uncharacterized protein
VQAQCPQCSTRFLIDDAKVPDRPFKVRCPRCQNAVTMQGRTAVTAEAGAAGDPPAAPEPAASPAPPPRSAPPAPLRREHTGSDKARDALIALADSGAGSAFTAALARLDYNVDVVEDVEEGTRLLEQGVYEIVVTTPPAHEPGRPETLAQRILRLPVPTRRSVFVVLVDPRFTTGEGTQAWALQADLVVNPRDAASCEGVIRSTIAERVRLYQAYGDAQRKVETEWSGA